MVARDSNTANAFETTLTAEMNDSTLTATVATTTGGPASPCYLVIEPDDNNQREYIYFDDTFTGTTFVSTALANRYLAGSAAGSGLTHPVGSVVRCAPVAQHFEDLHDRIDGVASPITTRGDIIRGDASGDPERLALGTSGQHLESDGTDVVWATPTTDPITTRGDLIRGDATGDAERLALGTTGQVVQSDGTDAAWATLDTSDLSDVDFTGLATGAVAYYDGTDWIDLPIGAADEVLTVNTGATAPEWAASSGGYSVQDTDANTSGGASTTTEFTVLTLTTPAGEPAAGDVYQIVAFGTMRDQSLNSRLKFKIGSTDALDTGIFGAGTSDTTMWTLRIDIVYPTTSTQECGATFMIAGTQSSSSWDYYNSGGTSDYLLIGSGSASESTAGAVDLKLTCKFDTSNSLNNMSCDRAFLRRLTA